MEREHQALSFEAFLDTQSVPGRSESEPAIPVEPSPEAPQQLSQHRIEKMRFDEAWANAKWERRQANIRAAHGRVHTTNGATYFQHGVGGRQSKDLQRKQNGNGNKEV